MAIAETAPPQPWPGMPAHAPRAALQHPAFAPYARWLGARETDAPPDLAQLNAWARESALDFQDGRPLVFVAARRSRESALAFERRIAHSAEIPTRAADWHDACNALAWLAFPRTKAALNAIHVAAGASPLPNARNSARDAATLLDESGLLVACADAELVALWRARAWRELFVMRREAVIRTFRVAAIGHGLLAKLRAPFRAVTAKALVLPLEAPVLPDGPAEQAPMLDGVAASRLAAFNVDFKPSLLLPLPVAALPGWDTEGLGPSLLEDVSVFRPRVIR